ncbi:MAG TPA: ShlB/FhaC/HecB family hemolysin secretion/activation protein [Terracidiphilus sp.]|nr:ShlB/FhaC/HecB family hemolysin secretion/activation protein [Terracidiphilus sp.]
MAAGKLATAWGSLSLSAAIVAAVGISSAWAQTNTRAADPGRIEQRFIPQFPKVLPPGPGIESPPQVEPTLTGASGTFTLAAVDIEGATIYSPNELAPLYEPYLAQTVTLADVQKILQAITDKYHADGYFLSRAVVEPQALVLGILRVRIIEGFVSAVEFQNKPTDRADLFNRFAAKIEAERPLRLTTLERYILLMGDLPGISLTPSLKAVDNDAGTFELVIRLDQKPVEALSRLDNHGTHAVGPLEATLSGALNSALGLGEQTRLSYVTVPNHLQELKYVELVHGEPIGAEGTRIALDGIYNDVHAIADAGSLPALSESHFLKLILAHPLVRQRAQVLNLTAQFDYENVALTRQGGTSFVDDLSVARIGGTYQLTDGWAGLNVVGLQASQGLGIFGATKPGAPNLSEPGGRSEFTKANFQLSRRQRISNDWAVLVEGLVQRSAQPLLLTEQFGLGGSRFGRGFDPSEITGDDGEAGSLELQNGRDPGWNWLQSYQLFAFFDVGEAIQRAPTGPIQQSLASTGLGVRVRLAHNLTGEVLGAFPVTQHVAPGTTRKGDGVFFTVTLQN